MDFSHQITQQIHQGFLARVSTTPYFKDVIVPKLASISSAEATILKFYYMGMPLADIGGVSFEMLLEYASFAYTQWQQLQGIPEELFLNYVAQYRINTEDIQFIRPQLNKAIFPLISGLPPEEAILKVNEWCASHMTYRLTDERTASPATSLRSGYGRCGEESSLLVEALRSVGIPARQVYTPKWAHCDDNHAWVEAWCDGTWRFLGACEPEPVLDKGWFNAAASRAMLVHTKVFGNITAEEIISQEGSLTLLNQTHRYAPCKTLTITVTHQSQPVEDAKIHLQLINMAEATDIALLTTAKDGSSKVTLGLGNLLVRAVHPHGWAEQQVDTAKCSTVELKLLPHSQLETGVTQRTMHAPQLSDQNTITLTTEQKTAHKLTLAQCDANREAYTASFFQSTLAEEFPCHIQELLREAKGNFEELHRFLATPVTAAEEALKYPLLASLTPKDYRDARCDVLLSHLKLAAPYQSKYPDEVFLPYLLCPRVGNEPLTMYRQELLSHLCPCQIESYLQSPKTLWQYILQNVTIANEDDNLIPAAPLSVCLSGIGTAKSAAVLMVAWCRSLGIPARLDPITSTPQYYNGEVFVGLSDHAPQPNTYLTIQSDNANSNWRYSANWSLSVLKDGYYQTLSLTGQQWYNKSLPLTLHSGSYRLITTNRLPNGNQHLHFYNFTLSAGSSPFTLPIQLPTANIRQMLSAIPLSNFAVTTLAGQPTMIADLLPHIGVIVWLETGREPTEHILNELIGCSSELNAINCPVILLVKDQKDGQYPLVQNLKATLANCIIATTDFSDTAQPLARRTFTDPDKLPLTIVVDQKLTGAYASSGYNVGEGALIIKILQALKQQ